MEYKKLAESVLENIGGKENIINFNHCMTRLRFNLKDDSKVKIDALKENENITSVLKTAGQYQVVVGEKVDEVYKEIVKLIDDNCEMKEESSDNKKKGISKLFSKLFD